MMSSYITIAGVEHADLLLKLSEQTFFDTFAKYNTPEDMQLYKDTHFTLAQVQSELKKPSVTFLLAFSGAIPAGYAKISDSAHPTELKDRAVMEIERIYVQEAFKGHQIGKALIAQCISIAREKGKNTVWLGVWEHNEFAIAFYQKQGFEVFGAHPFQLGNDLQNDWLMKKAI
jgi:diamine N-acetyltransferase